MAAVEFPNEILGDYYNPTDKHGRYGNERMRSRLVRESKEGVLSYDPKDTKDPIELGLSDGWSSIAFQSNTGGGGGARGGGGRMPMV